MALTVRVESGQVVVYENGSRGGSYGLKDIVDAATDGRIIAAVKQDGTAAIYENGSHRYNIGHDAKCVTVSNGVVAVKLKNGRTEEYENGSYRRSY